MGTNYYLKTNVCQHCGRGDEPRHIGKSSGGWCFALHIYPEDGINILADWEQLFKKQENAIFDEYGTPTTIAKLMEIITKRSWKPRNDRQPMGYHDWEDFDLKNYSQLGPNGLSRHKIDGCHCIGHGEGTYDYLVGEFC